MRRYFIDLGLSNLLVRCVGNFEPGQDVELDNEQIAKVSRVFKMSFGMNRDQIDAVIGKSRVSPPRPSRCWIAALQYTAGIDPDGETYLCSPWSRNGYSIGNINRSRFKNIWGGSRHKEIALKLNAHLQNGDCNPLTCRHYYSNLAIDAFLAGILEPLPKGSIEHSYGRFI